jgi:phage terminase small subunit
MTKKQKRFVEEYLIDLNATQAAIRAGYSPNTAKSIASELLDRPDVSDAVNKAIADRSKRTGINQDRVVQELAKIAFVNIRDVVDTEDATVLDTATDEDTACIESVRVKVFPAKDGEGIEREIKLSSKMKALELLGKHLGMFSDKLKVDADMDINIGVDYGEEPEGGADE